LENDTSNWTSQNNQPDAQPDAQPDEQIVEACGLPISKMKDAMGRYRVNLFKEFNRSEKDKYPVVYTMSEQDKDGLVSARRIYMESLDEYEAAIRLVGSWVHWQRLLKCNAFMKGPHADSGYQWQGLEQWRQEKRDFERSKARDMLWESAKKGNVTAQRLLFEEANKGDRGAGRPSNAEVKKEAREQAEHEEMFKKDLERVKGLKVVK